MISQIDSSTNHQDLRKIISNVSHHVVLASVEGDESPEHTIQLENVQRFYVHVGVPILPWMMTVNNRE